MRAQNFTKRLGIYTCKAKILVRNLKLEDNYFCFGFCYIPIGIKAAELEIVFLQCFTIKFS